MIYMNNLRKPQLSILTSSGVRPLMAKCLFCFKSTSYTVELGTCFLYRRWASVRSGDKTSETMSVGVRNTTQPSQPKWRGSRFSDVLFCVYKFVRVCVCGTDGRNGMKTKKKNTHKYILSEKYYQSSLVASLKHMFGSPTLSVLTGNGARETKEVTD